MITTAQTLRDIINAKHGPVADAIPHDMPLSDLGVDSMDKIDIIMDAEFRFRISITDADAEAAQTFGELVDVVDRIKGEQS